MLNQFNDNINKWSRSFLAFFKKKRKTISKLFIYLCIFIFIYSNINIRIVFLDNILKTPLFDMNYIYVNVLKGGFVYFLWIFSLMVNKTVQFVLFFPIFLFTDRFDLEQPVYLFISEFSYNTNKAGFVELKDFNDYFLFSKEFEFKFFKNEYFQSGNFIKIIILNSNLPIFFYFGLLFITSTILSLFLLSYLGLYGVFFFKFNNYNFILIILNYVF